MKKISKLETILDTIQTPSYVCEEHLLEANLKLLRHVCDTSGAKILLALKGFAMHATFDMVKKYLYGASASGLYEALLASEMGKEVHTYSTAFKDDEIAQIAQTSSHIIFNSLAQFTRFKSQASASNPKISLGIRVNPEISVAPVELYNPCSLHSRFGVKASSFELLDGIEGLHFHALCEESAESLEKVLEAFEERFGAYLSKLKWVNFGGGHLITKEGYGIDKLIALLKNFKEKYAIEVFLEPSEAIGWQTGALVASVLDIVDNGRKIAIVDVSAEDHMPDCLAMPYRPDVRHSAEYGIKAYGYQLAGNSCLAGDVIGDYSFDAPLEIGDKIIFEDMIHYTFVKSTMFNGLRHPSLALLKKDGSHHVVRKFSYQDYRGRLS